MLERLVETRRVNRREVLRGGRRVRPRPPWALPEPEFTQHCNGCGKCVAACPERLLRPEPGFGRQRLPVADFRQAQCTFCAQCVAVCDTGALVREPERAPWSLHASFVGGCLAQAAVECRICAEHCVAGAIRMTYARGGVARPRLDAARCTGCGACVAPCPVGALEMAPVT